MADESGISWTDATFNPWIGCEKVSPACAHCYAETLAVNRMGLRDEKAVWGEGANRRITADATWRKPIRWAKIAREGLLPNGTENLDGHRPRVFCASMADVFEERPDLEEPRLRLFQLIADTPELDWQILTKRPEFARDWLRRWYETPIAVTPGYPGDGSLFRFEGDENWSLRPTEGTPQWGVLANVWMGVSIENARWTWRADVLREIPASVRFISAEPLLGSLFTDSKIAEHESRWYGDPEVRRARRLNLDGIDWVIIGGESGGRAARPMHAEWAREIRDDVLDRATLLGETRPALHFKQWGSHDEDGVYRGPGPKSSGKMLDAVEWCEFPRVPVLA